MNITDTKLRLLARANWFDPIRVQDALYTQHHTRVPLTEVAQKLGQTSVVISDPDQARDEALKVGFTYPVLRSTYNLIKGANLSRHKLQEVESKLLNQLPEGTPFPAYRAYSHFIVACNTKAEDLRWLVGDAGVDTSEGNGEGTATKDVIYAFILDFKRSHPYMSQNDIANHVNTLYPNSGVDDKFVKYVFKKEKLKSVHQEYSKSSKH